MDGGEASRAALYRNLLDRFHSLEASHLKLQEQFTVLLQETTGNGNHRETSDSGDVTSFPGWGYIPGAHFEGVPYKRVLENMGHAVHVTRPASGEIIFWNSAAEKLFGYKEYEIIGKRDIELLFEEEHYPSALAIMDRLTNGGSWSGQFPLKKASGQTFMAILTKTPWYEDGELRGIVTVSSDASVFNNTNREQTKVGRLNLKKIQWHPQPQLASSVSNLASRVLSRRQSRNTRENEEGEMESQDVKADRPPRTPTAKPVFGFSIGKSKTEPMSPEKEDPIFGFGQPLKNAAKVLSKLQKGAISNMEKAMNENIEQNGSEDISTRKEVAYEKCERKDSIRTSHMCNSDASDDEECGPNLPNLKSMDVENASPRQSDSHKSGDCSGSEHEPSPRKGENDSNVVVDGEIRWEDLQLREDIGQGSFAIVYRGIWNGSDVAVKLYYGNQYSEATLLDYKKEIDIMRRLRHPNVLLFMGAVCSQEKLAIVTEYLPRGSLFKTLHKNNQSLDIKRRLRMAIDVARGMNYLHHRNPPIVHRDLKSSNLLVDKSWTVKVGDFGLSKLKHATFLTAKSGRGTPQWMAPEVLRNEPSTEKSDVFSFGVILWELMTESIPWNDLNSLQVVGIVGFMDRRLDIPEKMDPRVSSIIFDCWQSNPEHRPSFEDIIRKMTDLVHSGAVTNRLASTPSNFSP